MMGLNLEACNIFYAEITSSNSHVETPMNWEDDFIDRAFSERICISSTDFQTGENNSSKAQPD